ncbi:hypothetical protein FRC02_009820 [Tulasnella sp. 418]|nr:hypothetical protein FRC02_009820 [Tulasnella sp. 418]
MGAAVSAFRESILSSEKKNKEEIKQQLDFLVKAVESKLDAYQSALEDMFQDPNSVSSKQIPGIRAVRYERGYRVSVSKNAQEGIGEVVDAFFGAAETGMKGVVDGFKKVVGTALNAILGNDQAGQQEDQKFFVFMKNNAIIRIDIKMWRYNFSGKGVMAESENVFCYVFCLSVVDHYKLTLDELTFLFTEFAGDAQVEAYIDHLCNIWRKITAIPRDANIMGGTRIAGSKAKALEAAPSAPLQATVEVIEVEEPEDQAAA